MTQLADNLTRVHQRIDSACQRCGRDPTEIRLVAVTKYSPLKIVRSLLDTGQHVLGESRPQQLVERAEQLPETVEWHLIGQLQRNKVRAVLPHVGMIHSIDSLKLLRKVDEVAKELQLAPALLLQVNVSGEASKSGFTPEELQRSWADVEDLSVHRNICGLMTMAPLTDDVHLVRDCFAGLRELQRQLNECSKNIQLTELSMGMSGDFEIAIEEGATLIRLGSILFDGCPA